MQPWLGIKKWWRRLRGRADIPDEDRRLCARYGEAVLQLFLAGAVGSNTPKELMEIHNNTDEKTKQAKVDNIVAWIREQTDLKERRERRLELIEWGIILLIVLELKEGRDQTAVLDQLQKNAFATATTLTSLAATMKDMQETEHRLLAVNYEPSVNIWGLLQTRAPSPS